MKKVNKLLIFLIIVSIQVLIISLTYSYFDADYRGVENSTTIGVGSGEVSITYDGGPDLIAEDMDQSAAPIITKNFTVTAKNNAASINDLSYSLVIRATKNTFNTGALSYTLSSTGANGERVADQTTRKGIKIGAVDTFMGNGKFSGQIQNESHVYTLDIFFHPSDSDISNNMGKDFNSHVVVGEPIYPFNNPPALTAGLTPVKFDDDIEIVTTEDDEDWYDYENKKWANAKTDDGSYWVWIPRYAYKIKSCYHMNASGCTSAIGKEAGEIEIKFLDGTLDKTFAGEAVSLSPVYSGSAQTNFIKHPAFTFGADEIKGFWIGKFEPSGTSSSVSVKPNVASLRSMSISDQFTAALNMKDDLKFGWNASQADTHMLKNIEWGAVSYLSQSIYGANEEVYINNSKEYTTGCAGNTVSASSQAGCANAWNTAGGVKASTTNNITGVYDMSGGAYEYVAAYSDTGHSNIATYGQSLKNSYLAHGSKYVDYYVPTGDNIYKPEYYGDAMYETSSSGSSISTSWYNDYSYSPTNDRVFLHRGGDRGDGSRAGLFYFSDTDGDSYSYYSFRVAVALLP